MSVGVGGVYVVGSGFHLEGGREEASPLKAQLPPLKSYVSHSFYLNSQKEMLQKGRTLTIYTLYLLQVSCFEWVTIVANSSSLM